MERKRGSLHLLMFLFFAADIMAKAGLPLRDGWSYILHAQDLINGTVWSCGSNSIQTTSGALIATNSSNSYIFPTNSSATLEVTGDFSVLATLSSPSSSGTFLGLVDSNNGNHVDVGFGIAPGMIDIGYVIAGASGPGAAYALPEGASDPLTIELARIGKQFEVWVGGTQIGSMGGWNADWKSF